MSPDIASHPWLSILIPAYERPEGVLRILDAIAKEGVPDIECIIGDDSLSNSVEVAVYNHPMFLAGRIAYEHNMPPLGAISNWNNLLDRATGTHLMFMHHDEFPVTKGFFEKVRRYLQQGFDCVALNCWILDEKTRAALPHCSSWIKRLVLQHAPTYLMRRNIVGAPSTMIFRNKSMPRFDSRLPLLVDVDWYCKFLERPNIRRTFAAELCVASVIYADSITGRMGPKLADVARAESLKLRQEGKHFPGIVLCAPLTKMEKLRSTLEKTCWKAFRALEYPFRIAQRRDLSSLES